MIFTFTDFGLSGPYLGQVKAALWREAPGHPAFDLCAAVLPAGARMRLNGHSPGRAVTFSDVEAGQGFWYENSNGLAEIAVNCGSAADRFGGGIGDKVEII